MVFVFDSFSSFDEEAAMKIIATRMFVASIQLLAINVFLCSFLVCQAGAETHTLSDGSVVQWHATIDNKELVGLTNVTPSDWPGYNVVYQATSIPNTGRALFSATLPLQLFAHNGYYTDIAQATISIEDQNTTSSVFDFYISHTKSEDGTISYYMDKYFNYTFIERSFGHIYGEGIVVSVDQAFTRYLPATARTIHFAVFDSFLETRASGQIEIWRNPSSEFTIGNSPEKEGLCQDHPYTVCRDKAGPATCSKNGQGLPAYAVNTATRGLIVEDTLFTADSLGPPMTLALYYSPVPSRSGMFGNGWGFSLEERVDQGCASSLVRRGTHQVVSFSGTLCPSSGLNYPLSLTPAKGNFDRLERYEDHFKYRPKGSLLVKEFGLEQTSGHWLLTSVKDLSGNALTLTRDAQGRIASATDAAGRNAYFAYDANGRCFRIDTPDGRHASFVYDGNGNLIRVTDLAGIATDYVYNAQNYLTSMTVGGKVTAFAYDSADKGALASLTDAEGNKVTYARNTTHNAITRTDAQHHATIYQNVSGKTSQVVDPLGRTTTTLYDEATGAPSSITSPGNLTLSLAYDQRGNPVAASRSCGTLAETWNMTYDADDRLLTRVDPLGKTWTFTYDTAGRLASTATPAGLTTTITRDPTGLPRILTLPGGGTWTFLHDAKGNLSRATDPLGNSTDHTYDVPGLNRLSTMDPRGSITAFNYDDNRRLTQVTWPTGSSKAWTYGCCAPQSVTDERGGTTALVHDGLLRLTSRTSPDGGVTVFSYDEVGNLTRVTDPLGHVATLAYDSADRLSATVDPRGAVSQVGYNAIGLPTTYQDSHGKTITQVVDALGRRTGMTDQTGRTVSLTLDAAGRTTRLTNARGQTVDYAYDADDRVTEKKYNGVQAASYTYGPTGKLATIASASHGTTTFNRDVMARVVDVAYPDGSNTHLTYDAVGNISSVSYPGGLTAAYVYDARNQVTSVAFGGVTVNIAYDAAGNMIAESRSNGVTSSYGYDQANRLTSLAHAKGGKAFIQWVYTRNKLGQVTSARGGQPNEPRLGGSTGAGVYDAANRLVSFGSETATVDDDGNVTALLGGRGFTAVYDPENQPTRFTIGGITTTCIYDGLGNRVRRVRNGQVRNYHYDHLGRLLFETDASGAVALVHIYNGMRLIASGTMTGGFRFLHQDLTGNVLAMTDAAGAVVAAYAYAPFGRTLSKTGTAYSDFTYAGAYGVMDEGNGLYYMRHRYYDAIIGRFLQKDPLGTEAGFNFYRYVGDNPVSRIDPYGLAEDEVSGARDDYVEALHNGTLRDKRIEQWIDDKKTAADITLSAMPGVGGRLYTSIKCGVIGIKGGGLNQLGVADDILWELLKMVAGFPGAMMDFWDAANEVNVRRVRESQEKWLREHPELYIKDYRAR